MFDAVKVQQSYLHPMKSTHNFYLYGWILDSFSLALHYPLTHYYLGFTFANNP